MAEQNSGMVIQLIIPDEKTLVEYETIVGTLMLKYGINRTENVHLSAIRDMLLPKLLNGEIDVSGMKE